MNIQDIRQIRCLVRLVDYLVQTQKRSIDYLQKAKVLKTKQYLQMDAYTRFNLELLRTIRSEDRFGSLLWVLDKTKTAMGARLLKTYISRPLADIYSINERLDVVESFVNHFIARKEIATKLNEVYDLPRLIARIGYGNANARDLVQLSKSLKVIPEMKSILNESLDPKLSELSNKLNNLNPIVELIENAIIENPPFSIKEGGMFKEGYNEELDELRKLSKGGKEWINSLEAQERERTGIKTLRIGYNKVFGFYIEVSKGQLNQVKDEYGYIRKQTLVNGERFITQELKEKEDMILHAEDKMFKLEYEIFNAIKFEVKKYTQEIQMLSEIIAEIDVLRSFAEVSVNNNYVRPTFNDAQILNVVDGRHAVLEKVTTKAYVPNDIKFNKESLIQLITGPNMGGKSTYMREVALIVIMSQVGCFVPAKEAKLPVFDRIFTRIGASDDLVSGQSTFMVEMIEANNAIRNATPNSLILFDEIGRGTSTFDGMALAQAIIEYLCLNVKAVTLFSTHYHELTHLEGKIEGLKNQHVAVYEENDKVTFLYKIEEGPANKSYGINVARLAHLPTSLLDRAKDILVELENKKVSGVGSQYLIKEVVKESEVEKKLKEIDPLSMSPMAALNFLYDLKKDLK